jgi:hypothetical protein
LQYETLLTDPPEGPNVKKILACQHLMGHVPSGMKVGIEGIGITKEDGHEKVHEEI